MTNAGGDRPAKATKTVVRIGDLLVEQKLITAEQLQSVLAEQKRTGRKLGRVLVDSSLVTDEQISTVLASQLNLPFINLKAFSLKAAISRKLSEIHARRFRALVLEERDDALLVGMVDPTDLFAFDELSRALHRELKLAVIAEGQFLQALDILYRKTDEISDLTKELEQEVGNVVDFGQLAAGPALEEAPVVKLLQTIFEDAIQVRASDIHIEPQEGQLQIRFRIDGVLHPQTQADMKIASAVVVRLKLMSGLDISEKRLPQDGRFNVKLRHGVVIDVRLSTLPTQYGESVVMRLLNKKGNILDLPQIGMPEPLLERFQRIIRQPSGIVLVTGPTGSGKTTSLYATLAELNSPEHKIITVEDPVEYRLAGVNQVQVNEKIDLTFARVLRSILRQDPDIVLVGEIRDSDTAEIALRAAMTGHLILSTLHTNSAATTPARLIDIGIPPFMLASSLLAVVAQRLVRKVCENCVQPYNPNLIERQWLDNEGVSQEQFSTGKGCNLCNGTGCRGRIPVYEMLEITQPVAEAIHRFEPLNFEKVAKTQMEGNTLRTHAIALACEGKTTVAEAIRISSMIGEEE